MSPIHRNVTVHAVYRAYMPALTADAEAEKSPVLMGGEFYPDTKIAVREATDEELAQVKANIDNDSPFYKYYLKKVYYYEVSQAQPLQTNAIVRVLNDTRLADSLMTMDAEYQTVGEAQKADTIGSYLSSDTQFCRIYRSTEPHGYLGGDPDLSSSACTGNSACRRTSYQKTKTKKCSKSSSGVGSVQRNR